MNAWTQAHVRAIDPTSDHFAPVIGAGDVRPVLAGFDIWDMWPLALADGQTAQIGGDTIWFALSAPKLPDPVERHAVARIRLLLQRGENWRDGGNALPDGMNPGSREWSGSAIYDPGSREVTLFYTAAGRAGEARPSYVQRLFMVRGTLRTGGTVSIDWQASPREIVYSDDRIYHPADQPDGAPGKIAAFRDPAYFRDPHDGASYLVFAASLKQSAHAANGTVGIARARDAALQEWALLPPILHAEGVNTELERPHVLFRDGHYYLFWSTQRHTFAQGGAAGPNGLYGMVAPALFGPYRPLNGSGLVLANPPSEPLQAYSWWVLHDARVTSFVDLWGLHGRVAAGDVALQREQFGGTPAPFVQLRLQGDRSRIDTAHG